MKCRGREWMISGIVLIIMAIFIIAWNIREDNRAEINTRSKMQKLEKKMEEISFPESNQGELEGIEMPVQRVDGKDYIGILELPSLEKRLPVMNQWSYPNLRIAPCCYAGSIYENNGIIMAHNYLSHFGALKKLQIGDQVIFIDVDSNKFFYQVIGMEVLNSSDVELMKNGKWDLTLFTCTLDGNKRMTIRCKRSDL